MTIKDVIKREDQQVTIRRQGPKHIWSPPNPTCRAGRSPPPPFSNRRGQSSPSRVMASCCEATPCNPSPLPICNKNIHLHKKTPICKIYPNMQPTQVATPISGNKVPQWQLVKVKTYLSNTWAEDLPHF